jgi:hypothetical protein
MPGKLVPKMPYDMPAWLAFEPQVPCNGGLTTPVSEVLKETPAIVQFITAVAADVPNATTRVAQYERSNGPVGKIR